MTHIFNLKPNQTFLLFFLTIIIKIATFYYICMIKSEKMINRQLISPKSIVVVGGSDDTQKPGGNTLKNLLDTHYSGDLFVVNPKADSAQGVKSYRNIEDIPEEMIYAAVAIEDHRFFEHQGVDWITTVKACANMFVGATGQFGGSSITQQLVKNYFKADDVTVQRKVLEIFRAAEFERLYDKQVIMEWYLNNIFLGNRCTGVKTAAAKYFGKELEKLTLAEGRELIRTSFPIQEEEK